MSATRRLTPIEEERVLGAVALDVLTTTGFRVARRGDVVSVSRSGKGSVRFAWTVDADGRVLVERNLHQEQPGGRP